MKQRYLSFQLLPWSFWSLTVICAVVNISQKRSVKLWGFTPSAHPDSLQCGVAVCSLSLLVWGNKVKVFLREGDHNQFRRFVRNRSQPEFHRVFTRWIQNSSSGLQNSRLLLVKNNKYTLIYVSPRTVLWHLSDISCIREQHNSYFHL